MLALSQSMIMPASSGSSATLTSISSLVIAAAFAQSERDSPRCLMASNSSAVCLTICSFFAIARPPERNDPPVLQSPRPNDRVKLAVDQSGRNNPVLVVPPRRDVIDRATVEHLLGIDEVQMVLARVREPLCRVP